MSCRDGVCSECGSNCWVDDIQEDHKHIAALEAKLAEVTEDRDHEASKAESRGALAEHWEARARTAEIQFLEVTASLPSIQVHAHGMGQESAREEIDALRAEVATLKGELGAWAARAATTSAEAARLRAAIEPTATWANELASVMELANDADDSTSWSPLALAVLAAIRARAGEVSAPVSSLRERVEAACRELEEKARDVGRLIGDDDAEQGYFEGKEIAWDEAARIVRAALGEP